MEERLFMILEYYKWEYAEKVRSNFSIKFRKKPPTVASVTRTFQKLMETGSVNDREHLRKRTVTHEENSLVISKKIKENNGEISTRQLALDTNMSRSSVMKMLKDRKLFPYKKRYVHEMKLGNSVERLAFCLKAKEMVEEGLFVGPLLVFSDEAYFHLTGHINKQNDRVWATSKPITSLPRPVFAKKIGV